MSDSSYCVKCKTKTGSVGETLTTTKNGRKMMKSKCTNCGTTKTRFVASGAVKGKTGNGFPFALAASLLL